MSGPLRGRDTALALLDDVVARAVDRGAALLLSGEPGSGKTALLDVAAGRAATAGALVVRVSGVEYLADQPGAGLARTVLPLRAELLRLDPVQRDALVAATTAADAVPGPEDLLVFGALLALLRRASRARPLLIVADDLQWLDRTSAAALAFVARRLHGSRVGVLAAARPGHGGVARRSGLPEHRLGPLEPGAAADLLHARFPALSGPVADRLLEAAAGNPLALLELPAALTPQQRAGEDPLPATLPLGDRLRVAFAAGLDELPTATRQLLLVAVLGGAEALRALRGRAGEEPLADLAPAELARVVDVEPRRNGVTFRHPLMPAVAVELATPAERRAAHLRVAELLADDPDRRPWHLADAAPGPDEELAALLEAAAGRAADRGDAAGAVRALRRAADLSVDRPPRARRLAAAAYLEAAVTGRLHVAGRLLVDVRREHRPGRPPLHAAAAAAHLLLQGDGDVHTAHRLLAAAVAAAAEHPGDPRDALVDAVHALVAVCAHGGRPEHRRLLDRAVGLLEPEVPQLVGLAAAVATDPAGARPQDVERVDAAVGALPAETNPARIVRTAAVALSFDRVVRCREALHRVVVDGRRGGAVAAAVDAIATRCVDDLLSGRWEDSDGLIQEGLDLCDAHGHELARSTLSACRALLAAALGDDRTARDVAGRVLGWAQPRDLRGLEHLARYALGLAALGRGAHEEAYAQVSAVSPAGEPAGHARAALWVPLDLVEAAVGTGRHREAAAHAALLRDAGWARRSPRLAMLVPAAAAVTAPDDRAGALFEEALAVAGADEWPFPLARVHLARGRHLRRRRRTPEAAASLTAALETFQRLGARPWEAQARTELRAAGVATGVDAHALPALTPEEHEIAALAASGLSNREIGERLFLSHRTVAARLRRIFPKLGVVSRAALRDALRLRTGA